ncbi:MAG: cation:proton antiporter [Bacteroidota bacterium]
MIVNNWNFLTIIAAMQVDPILSKLVLLAVSIIIIGFVLKLFKQPYIIAYIIAGVLMGPSGMQIVVDEGMITNMGSFGLVLLLFFIGMEISLPELIANWRISVFGTFIQVLFSIAVVWIIGYVLNWPLNRIIMFGFVISLSSTAVVIKLLHERNEANTRIGQNVIGILLAQDVIIVPMLITLNYLSGKTPETMEIMRQITGGSIIIGIIAWVLKKKHIKLPFDNRIKDDHEIQVFIAFAVCFGFSILTAFFGLSSALGAFVAGVLVSSANATKWVHESLHAFRVVFVALFFVSIGMLINLHFLKENITTVLLFVFLIFFANNLINAIIMRIFGMSWRESIYTGAILAQIGEFSFILGSTGFMIGMITEYSYQLIISIISITLIISPAWIVITRSLVLKNRLLH